MCKSDNTTYLMIYMHFETTFEERRVSMMSFLLALTPCWLHDLLSYRPQHFHHEIFKAKDFVGGDVVPALDVFGCLAGTAVAREAAREARSRLWKGLDVNQFRKLVQRSDETQLSAVG